jgi:hypothetical protein
MKKLAHSQRSILFGYPKNPMPFDSNRAFYGDLLSPATISALRFSWKVPSIFFLF